MPGPKTYQAIGYATYHGGRFYGKQKRGKDDPEPRQQALATFCHALLSSNPFLYVD